MFINDRPIETCITSNFIQNCKLDSKQQMPHMHRSSVGKVLYQCASCVCHIVHLLGLFFCFFFIHFWFSRFCSLVFFLVNPMQNLLDYTQREIGWLNDDIDTVFLSIYFFFSPKIVFCFVSYSLDFLCSD